MFIRYRGRLVWLDNMWLPGSRLKKGRPKRLLLLNVKPSCSKNSEAAIT